MPQFRCTHCSKTKEGRRTPICGTPYLCDWVEADDARMLQLDLPQELPVAAVVSGGQAAAALNYETVQNPTSPLLMPEQTDVEELDRLPLGTNVTEILEVIPTTPGPMPFPVNSVTLDLSGRTFRITQRTVLGRNGDVATELFRGYREVSRRHCELAQYESVWTLTHLSEHSPSRLNGDDLIYRQPTPLRAGKNELLLGEVLVLSLRVYPPQLENTNGHTQSPSIIDQYRRNGKLQAVLTQKQTSGE